MPFVTKNIFLFLFFLYCGACTHTSKLDNTRSYLSSREETWKALVYIFKSYPIKIIDPDKGYIETKILKSSKFWKAPHKKDINTSGLSAIIKVNLFYNKPYSKVEIQKIIHRRESFFSEPKRIDSDLLEENSIFYRLGRELYIRKGFNRISK